MPKRKWTAEDVPMLLERLACEEPAVQQATLAALCPCRSRCDDRAIWGAICQTYDSPHSPVNVINQAKHAIETLIEKAAIEARAQELLDWLQEERLLVLPLEKQKPTRKSMVRLTVKERKVTSMDIPQLLDCLHYGEEGTQRQTLRTLCPCRNVRYDKEVWLTIFRLYESGDTPGVRDDASHAIGTLIERAQNDPRSQDLLRWLAGKGITSIHLDTAIPTWQPLKRGGLNGLYIPRYERHPRSRANRRR